MVYMKYHNYKVHHNSSSVMVMLLCEYIAVDTKALFSNAWILFNRLIQSNCKLYGIWHHLKMIAFYQQLHEICRF